MSSGHALVIADATFARLSDLMRGDFRSFRRTPLMQVNPENLPVLGVYILRERGKTDGDSGPPAFINELTLGISGGVDVGADDEAAMTGLETTMSRILDALMTYPAWVNLSERVIATDRVAQYSKEGETSLAEIRVEVVLQFRTTYPPVITDELHTVHVKTSYPGPTSEVEGVMQISAEYDLTTT